MNIFLDSEIVQRAGWTLVHSLWQLSIVVGITVLVTASFGRGRANIRYLLGCLGLLACTVVPIATYQTIQLTSRASGTIPMFDSASTTSVPSAIGNPHSAPPSDATAMPPVSWEISSQGVNKDVSTSVERPSPSQWFLLAVDAWLPTIFFVWVVGVFVLATRPLAGLFFNRKLRVHGRSPVPVAITRTLEQSCHQLRLNHLVEIAQSTLIQVPSVVCYFKPLILLPTSGVTGLSSAELQTIIVHELAHVRRHDYLVNLVQTIIESLLFFHPLVWWLSSRVRIERENCCDDIVLQACDDRTQYVRALMHLADADEPSLAMCATGGSLVQRVQRILGKQTSTADNTWLAGLIVLALLTLVPLSRSAQLLASPPIDADKKSAAATSAVRVVSMAGEPMADARVEIQLNKDKRSVKTNANGIATIALPKELPELFSIRVSGDFVPMKAQWKNGNEDEPDPVPGEITFNVEPGKKVSGQVSNERGEPIAGATIKPAYFALVTTMTKRIQDDWPAETRVTDENGRWAFERVSSTTAGFNATITHPEYGNDFVRFATVANVAHASTMKPAVTVRGTIVNSSGDPLANTQVISKYATPGSWTTRTNDRGEYEFRQVKPDEVRVTVAHKNFAPQSKKLTNLGKDNSIDFQLHKGTPVRFRFVDDSGAPVAGVHVQCVHFINGQGLHTFEDAIPRLSDASGTWLWKNAPRGSLGFTIKKRGYLQQRHYGVETRVEPHKFVMNRVLDISGSVTDKETGKPILEFAIVRGNWSVGNGLFAPGGGKNNGGIAWDFLNPRPMANGSYDLRITQSQSGHYVKVNAPGYKPAASREITDAEGKVSINFQLVPSNGNHGRIVNQSGDPVQAADVHYILPGRRTEVRNGEIENGATINTVSDSEGKFVLPEQDQTYAIMVIADDGYAFVLEDEFKRAKQQIEISRWATVSGKCMIGSQPAVGKAVSMHAEHSDRVPQNLQPSLSFWGKVQADGNYKIPRVPPDINCSIGRTVSMPGGMISASSHTQTVHTKPARVSRVDIGGVGRPVIGKVQLPPGSKRKVEDWNMSVPQITGLNREELSPSEKIYTFAISEDRTFRVEDLPAGDYRVLVFALERHASNPTIGRIESTFTIPEMEGGRSDEPFDLGTLEVTLEE